MNYSKSPAVTFWWSLQSGASLGLTGRVSTWHAVYADFNWCLWAASKQNTRRSSSIYYLFYSNYIILFWCFCIFEHFLEQECPAGLIKFYVILSYILVFLIYLSTLKKFKKNFFIFRLVVSKQSTIFFHTVQQLYISEQVLMCIFGGALNLFIWSTNQPRPAWSSSVVEEVHRCFTEVKV